MKTIERIKQEIAKIEAIIELGGPSTDERRYYSEGSLYALRWVIKEESK